LVNEFELIGGEMLDVLPDAEMATNSFNQLMSVIDEQECLDANVQNQHPQSAEKESSHVHPIAENMTDKPLIEGSEPVLSESDYAIFKQLQQKQFDDLKWEKITGRIRKATIAMNDSIYEVSLLNIAANTKVPKHTHCGSEYTLVLQGDFKDKAGRYGPGEFIYQDESHEHQPIAGKEGCICLAITDAPMKFTGTFGGVLNWFNR
jgi:putative transcriptional regulator